MRKLTAAVAALSVAAGSISSDDVAASESEKLGITETFGRWPDGIVPYVYNPDGAAVEFSDNDYLLDLLNQAIGEIEGVSGVRFDYQGISGATILDYNDGIVTFGWDDIGGAAGQAGPAQGCTGNDVVAIGYCAFRDGSLRLNNDPNDVQWDQGDVDDMERRLVSVATHELLHLLGVGHSEDPQSIMYADPYTSLHHLRDDDIDALQALYGKPAVFTKPPTFEPPAPGGMIDDSFVSTSDDAFNEITTLDDAEAAPVVGVLWQVSNPHTADASIVAVDPDGYYYARKIDARDCTTGGGCLFWIGIVSTDVLKLYPGTWTFQIIINGGLVSTESLDVQTAPAHNQPPDARVAFDTIYGAAPLTVNAKLTVTGDQENDAVDAAWHIPTVGEIELGSGNFPGSAGQDSQTVTFVTPGDYEIYVEVNDDFVRYGTPGSGSEAGPGFRHLFRQVIHVTDVPDDVVSVGDISGDTVPDFAIFIPGAKPRIRLLSGANGAKLSNLAYLGGNWKPIALDHVADADGNSVPNDPAVAMLATNLSSGRHRVQTRRLDNGQSLGNITFLSANWTPLDIVVINDTDGDGLSNDASIGVLAANKGNGKIAVQIRRLSDGSLVRKINYFGSKWLAQAAAVVLDESDGPLVAVLATNVRTGKIIIQSRLLSTGVLDRNTAFFNSAWIARDVAAVTDLNSNGIANDPAWQVLATQGDTGDHRVQSRRVSNGSRLKTLRFINANWAAWRLTVSADISGNVAEEIAVAARKKAAEKRIVKIRDYATTDVTGNISP